MGDGVIMQHHAYYTATTIHVRRENLKNRIREYAMEEPALSLFKWFLCKSRECSIQMAEQKMEILETLEEYGRK